MGEENFKVKEPVVKKKSHGSIVFILICLLIIFVLLGLLFYQKTEFQNKLAEYSNNEVLLQAALANQVIEAEEQAEALNTTATTETIQEETYTITKLDANDDIVYRKYRSDDIEEVDETPVLNISIPNLNTINAGLEKLANSSYGNAEADRQLYHSSTYKYYLNKNILSIVISKRMETGDPRFTVVNIDTKTGSTNVSTSSPFEKNQKIAGTSLLGEDAILSVAKVGKVALEANLETIKTNYYKKYLSADGSVPQEELQSYKTEKNYQIYIGENNQLKVVSLLYFAGGDGDGWKVIDYNSCLE